MTEGKSERKKERERKNTPSSLKVKKKKKEKKKKKKNGGKKKCFYQPSFYIHSWKVACTLMVSGKREVCVRDTVRELDVCLECVRGERCVCVCVCVSVCV